MYASFKLHKFLVVFLNDLYTDYGMEVTVFFYGFHFSFDYHPLLVGCAIDCFALCLSWTSFVFPFWAALICSPSLSHILLWACAWIRFSLMVVGDGSPHYLRWTLMIYFVIGACFPFPFIFFSLFCKLKYITIMLISALLLLDNLMPFLSDTFFVFLIYIIL